MVQASSILECGRWLFFSLFFVCTQKILHRLHVHVVVRGELDGTVKFKWDILNGERNIFKSIQSPCKHTDISNWRKRIAKFIINLWHSLSVYGLLLRCICTMYVYLCIQRRVVSICHRTHQKKSVQYSTYVKYKCKYKCNAYCNL